MKRIGLAALAGVFASVCFYLPASFSARQTSKSGSKLDLQPAVEASSHSKRQAGPMVAQTTSAPSSAPAAASAVRTVVSPAAPTSTPAVARREWDPAWFESLRGAVAGDPVSFELVNGARASGVIRFLRQENNEVVYVAGDVTSPERGRFFFQKQSMPGVAGSYVGVVELPRSRRAYRLEPTSGGDSAELVERDLGEVVCTTLPVPEAAGETSPEVEEFPPLKPGDFPTLPIPGYQNGIVRLQSLPGARAVVYLDFQGGSTRTWGGITYARPNMSNNQIREVWLRVAEDYLPFQVNITTDLAVYEAAAENSRIRVIITPTTTAQPGSGGVAYMNSFNWTGDTPAWVFLTSPKDCAEACSHEVGHTLGLSHDGQDVNGTLTEYYGGQGAGELGWAPIMGVGYGRNVSQWDKGEFSGANNAEDDLLILTTRNNNVVYRADDAAGSVTSRYLEIQPSFVVSAQGVIERSGDVDAFNFSTRGGQASLRADPVGVGPNLAVSISLHNAAGEPLLKASPATTLWASFSTNLSAGDYTLRVTGAQRGNSATTGFSAYASLGYYSISGTIANAVVASRFAVPENSVAGTVAGVIAVENPDGHALSFRIASGNTGSAFAIDKHGVVMVANPQALDYEALGRASQLPVQYELFVEIIDQQDGSLTDMSHRVVVAVSDVNEPPTAEALDAVLLQNTASGTSFGSVTAADPDAYTLLSYSIVSGNGNRLFQIDSATGELSAAVDLPESAVGPHHLGVRVSDQHSSGALSVTSSVAVTVVPNTSGFRPGSIAYAVYTNVPGSSLASLTNSSRFPLEPAYERQLTRFEAGQDLDDRFGAVVRGYLIPPASGQFRFFIASDDSSQLWLGNSTNPASVSLVAGVSDGFWTAPREWTRYSSQQSKPVVLTAGKAYYIEARMREGTGNDHLSVAWESLSNGINREVIPGRCLAPFKMNYLPRATNLSLAVHRDAIGGARLGTVIAADANERDGHSYSIIAGGDGMFSIERKTGMLRVADETALAEAPQTSISLSVKVEDDGSPSRYSVSTVSIKLLATNATTAITPQQELFHNVGAGTTVAHLTNSAKYPRRPDALFPLTGWVGQNDAGENYGSRVRALLVPPTTGTYYFHLASDDSSSLRFSSTADPASARQVASVAGYTDPGQWNKYPSQRSAAVSLVAGRSYFLETLHKEGASLDHLSVAWSGPGTTETNPIPASALRPFNINYPPTVTDRSAQLPRTATNGTPVAVLSALDSPADPLTYKIIGGNDSNVFEINPDTGQVTLVDNTAIADYRTDAFTLEILVQDSGFGGLFPRRSVAGSVSVTIVDPSEYAWSGAGGNDLWDEPQNWAGGALPIEGAKLKFAGTTRQANQNNLLRSLGPVTFASGGFQIRGEPARLLAGLTSSGDNSWVLNSALNRSQGFTNLSGTFTISGDLDLGSNTLHISSAGDTLLLGALTGEGRLVKTGPGTMTLDGTISSTATCELLEGSTRVTGSESFPARVDVGEHAELGAGSDAKPLIVPVTRVLNLAGSITSPAVIEGVLRGAENLGPAMFEAGVQLLGRTELRVRRSPQARISDTIVVRGDLVIGGVLQVLAEGDALQAGDSFDLIQTEAISGEFASLELPELPPGLRWDVSSLGTDGLIRVTAAAAVPQVLAIRVGASGELELGIVTEPGRTYELQETENLGKAAGWRTVSSHAGDGKPLAVTLPAEASGPSRFFRCRVY